MSKYLKIENCGECPNLVKSNDDDISNYCERHNDKTIDDDLSIPGYCDLYEEKETELLISFCKFNKKKLGLNNQGEALQLIDDFKGDW